MIQLVSSNKVNSSDKLPAKDINEDRIIKSYFQLLTGMPVLLVRSSCFAKLDNLYKHSNIFGFTFGRRNVWRIVGTTKSNKEGK